MRGLLQSGGRIAARVAPLALACHYSANHGRSECATTFSTSTYPANDPIEDRHVFRSAGEWGVAAVFDGHGGWQVSDYASQLLLDKVLGNIANVSPKDEIALDEKIQEAFESMERDIVNRVRPAFNLGFGEVAKVGSCVVMAMKRADRLVVANCGDCRAVLGTAIPDASNAASSPAPNGNNKGQSSETPVKYVSTRITRDHNIRVPLEQLRLEQDHPGEENLYRCKNPHACYVKGRLQLTRSLGDVYLKSAEFNGSKDRHRSGGRYIPDPYTPPYVSHQPDLHHLRLDRQDRFVILASDGLWDYLSDQEAVDIVASFLPAHLASASHTDTPTTGGSSAGAAVTAAATAAAATAGAIAATQAVQAVTRAAGLHDSNGNTGGGGGIPGIGAVVAGSAAAFTSTVAAAAVAGTVGDTGNNSPAEELKPRWELLAAERLVQRALEIAAAEDGLTMAQLKSLPPGRARRSRHDDTTAVVMFF